MTTIDRKKLKELAHREEHRLNRGVLLTPFHNMALMCPATTEADIDLHTKIFGEAARELIS